jgi:excisionase family DNA binding protein
VSTAVDPDHFTLKQGAAKVPVSYRTFRRWVAAGLLPVVRIGRIVRVPRAGLEELLRARGGSAVPSRQSMQETS